MSILRSGARLAGFSLVTGLVCLAVYSLVLPDYDELLLTLKNKQLKSRWASLHERLDSAGQALKMLEDEDDSQYRVLLNMEKLSPEIRKGGSGGHGLLDASSAQVSEINSGYSKLSRLKSRITLEHQSIKAIRKRMKYTEGMLSSRPALQPIDNRHLTRFHPAYGMRLHPVHADWRFHHGLDLTADTGTPVYATGDGLVTIAKYSGGYGNVIFVNHGYGFETRYAHLSRIKVTEGQKVTRGELIGLVGNTGVSTGPHLHYEVLYKDKWINPIHFMYRDLPQAAYNDIIRKAAR
ncbi:MAG: M23 family metallopeptidase [Bacteroidota bacterium]